MEALPFSARQRRLLADLDRDVGLLLACWTADPGQTIPLTA